MVDALRSARSVLEPRGILVDARPDSRVDSRIEHGGTTVGIIDTQAVAKGWDADSDRAVATAKRQGLIRRIRAGRFWHRMPFPDRKGIDAYLRDHMRLAHRARWTEAWRRHAREWSTDPLEIVRPVRYEVLAGGPTRSSSAPA